MNVKPADTCQFDLLALGEIMLRLDPGEGRIRTTRNHVDLSARITHTLQVLAPVACARQAHCAMQ